MDGLPASSSSSPSLSSWSSSSSSSSSSSLKMPATEPLPMSTLSSSSLPKSMQQIAFLIITFSVYVAGIRNEATSSTAAAGGGGGGGGGGAFVASQHNYASYAASPSPSSLNRTPQPSDYYGTAPVGGVSPSSGAFEATAPIRRQSAGFRPSPIIDFTLSDASATTAAAGIGYAQDALQAAARMRYEMTKQFAFPSDEQPQSTRAHYNHNYNNHYQQASNAGGGGGGGDSKVPAQLQSTPILIYRDPYTQYHHYTETPPPRSPTQQRWGSSPQEYTVHSSLLVDTSRPPPTAPLRSGYVFAEPVGAPSYAAVAQQPPSNALYQRQHQRQRDDLTTEAEAAAAAKLSYDSHDYPPPSYFKQQTSNFQSAPSRQDAPNYAGDASPATPPASSPNYANNFGNYLQGEGEQPTNYKRPPSVQVRPQFQPQPQPQPQSQPQSQPRPPPAAQAQRPYYAAQQRPPPSFNNYYGYQLGEVPPQPPQPPHYGYYRPPQQQQQPQYHPQQQQQQPTSGLASLASLLSTTQQYAPQFTNLLLGGGGGGGGGASGGGASPLIGSLLGAFTGAAPTNGAASYGGGGGGYGGGGGGVARPLNMQLIRALENIARNDDLQCVPKVLCQTIAGQTQRGQLPSFVTSPAITNFLAGFPATSPALIYGRAALLAISGGERSCAQTYANCPKNEYEIIYYLNNHRGGFFKFFSEPEEQTAAQQTHNGAGGGGSGGGGGGGGGNGGDSGASSLFSILSALTGNDAPPSTTPRPRPRPTAASSSTSGLDGIGNFFTQVLSDYLGGIEHQRRRRAIRRRRAPRLSFPHEPEDNGAEEEIAGAIEQEAADAADFHDTEDDEDTQNAVRFDEGIEGRILHKDAPGAEEAHGPRFFPANDDASTTKSVASVFEQFNRDKSVRKLKFPSATAVRIYELSLDDGVGVGVVAPVEEGASDNRVHFHDDGEMDGDALTERERAEAEEESYGAGPIDLRRGKEVVFKEPNDVGHDVGKERDWNWTHDQRLHEEEPHQQRVEYETLPLRERRRLVFPEHDYATHIRKGRILNRPSYAASYSDYIRNDEPDRFVVSNAHRRPASRHEDAGAGGGAGAVNYNAAYYSAQNSYASQTQLTNNYNDRYYRPATTAVHAQRDYNYPNNRYVSNNRYSSDYQAPQHPATRRPTVREDDKNVYVTNAHGVTEYYLTPDGRKVFLK